MNITDQAQKNLDDLNERIIRHINESKINNTSQQDAIKQAIKSAIFDGLVTDDIKYQLSVKAKLQPDDVTIAFTLDFIF